MAGTETLNEREEERNREVHRQTDGNTKTLYTGIQVRGKSTSR